MGAKREDATMYELVEYLKSRNKSLHSSFEPTFLGESNQWCLDSIRSKRMNLIGGERIGIKTKGGKQILLEDLMEERTWIYQQIAVEFIYQLTRYYGEQNTIG